jgi:hypothetical protein
MHTETPATVVAATVPTDANTLFMSIELCKVEMARDGQ